MKLRLRNPLNSKKLNSFQQAAHISNETSELKISHFAKRWKPPWAQVRSLWMYL
jgi:hypothetical protein